MIQFVVKHPNKLINFINDMRTGTMKKNSTIIQLKSTNQEVTNELQKHTLLPIVIIGVINEYIDVKINLRIKRHIIEACNFHQKSICKQRVHVHFDFNVIREKELNKSNNNPDSTSHNANTISNDYSFNFTCCVNFKCVHNKHEKSSQITSYNSHLILKSIADDTLKYNTSIYQKWFQNNYECLTQCTDGCERECAKKIGLNISNKNEYVNNCTRKCSRESVDKTRSAFLELIFNNFNNKLYESKYTRRIALKYTFDTHSKYVFFTGRDYKPERECYNGDDDNLNFDCNHFFNCYSDQTQQNHNKIDHDSPSVYKYGKNTYITEDCKYYKESNSYDHVMVNKSRTKLIQYNVVNHEKLSNVIAINKTLYETINKQIKRMCNDYTKIEQIISTHKRRILG